MRIVIDMPDGMYNSIIENGKGTIAQLTTELYGILYRATPLPEGHGRLKEVLDKIRAEIVEMRSKQNVGVLECLYIIDKYRGGE